MTLYGNIGEGYIIGTTPNAPHKVFQKLPEYDEIYQWLQRDYYDRIPLWEEWRQRKNQTLPAPERITRYFTRSIDDAGYLIAVPIVRFIMSLFMGMKQEIDMVDVRN